MCLSIKLRKRKTLPEKHALNCLFPSNWFAFLSWRDFRSKLSSSNFFYSFLNEIMKKRGYKRKHQKQRGMFKCLPENFELLFRGGIFFDFFQPLSFKNKTAVESCPAALVVKSRNRWRERAWKWQSPESWLAAVMT